MCYTILQIKHVSGNRLGNSELWIIGRHKLIFMPAYVEVIPFFLWISLERFFCLIVLACKCKASTSHGCSIQTFNKQKHVVAIWNRMTLNHIVFVQYVHVSNLFIIPHWLCMFPLKAKTGYYLYKNGHNFFCYDWSYFFEEHSI